MAVGEAKLFFSVQAKRFNYRRCCFLFGPLTHAIFDAISDPISLTKRALLYPARMLFFVKHRVDWKESYHILYEDALLSKLGGILAQRSNV